MIGKSRRGLYAVAFPVSAIFTSFAILILQLCVCKTSPIATPAVAGEIPVMKIPVNPAYPPFVFFDAETGEIVGYDIDVLREIAVYGGFEIEFIPVGSFTAIPGTDNDTTNAVTGSLPYIHEQYPEYECSKPYSDDTVICVKMGNEELLALVNKGIRALPEDTIPRLEQKWRIDNH